MIVLSQTTDKIQVVLAGAVATNQAQCIASWRDITSAPTYTGGRSVANTNGTTDVDLIASPASSTQRIIDYIGIYNNDTATVTLTVKFDANGTDYIVWRGSLATGEHLEYENGKGWTVKTAGGLIKTLQSQSISTVLNDLNTTILGTDVINNNATANTIADVTGLSFPVVAGELYWFRFDIVYDAAATTTGSRWSINGPGSPTRLCYTSEYSLAATTTTRNANNISYDLPAASNATSGATAGNQAVITGIIQPSSNGNVIARVASEVSASAITAKAGSRVQWQRTL
jgi:hypothetical protein